MISTSIPRKPITLILLRTLRRVLLRLDHHTIKRSDIRPLTSEVSLLTRRHILLHCTRHLRIRMCIVLQRQQHRRLSITTRSITTRELHLRTICLRTIYRFLPMYTLYHRSVRHLSRRTCDRRHRCSNGRHVT